ncbi:alpha/beta fold hydrolase [Dyadobacter sp. CY326]|uniref:alpha/beta fold hydrolase n=1 Tax=Dyadobacter sp. CY326 TaxID=2907300 RepID=UPI001F3CC5F0|nr:alpha/beta hydrolase [Dyadobacter sp. CY326]MCE7067028.1 alpha/beta hydrolase [Dyadobacter sp. CY326]
MPVLLLALILTNFFTIAFLGLEIYLVREWYLHNDIIGDYDYAQRCLIGAIALLVFLIFGKTLIRMLLSKSAKGVEEPTAERFDDQVQLERPDGSVINIEQGGVKGKQTIVFIHGWNSNSMQWYYQKKYFASTYHLVLMDHPGLGKSKRAKNKDFSLEKLAADLDAVIEKSGAKDPILWGHSMGGMTILTFCKVYKHKLSNIKGIILEHTTFTNPTKTAILSSILPKIQNSVLKPICWLMVILSPLLWLSRWMSYFNGNMLIMTRFLTFAGTQTGKQLDFASYLAAMAPPAVTGRGVLAMFEYDATSTLPEIEIPTLIIGANKDRLTKLDASVIMNQKIPGSKLVTLQPAGHMGFVERNQEVNQAVSQFISTGTLKHSNY